MDWNIFTNRSNLDLYDPLAIDLMSKLMKIDP